MTKRKFVRIINYCAKRTIKRNNAQRGYATLNFDSFSPFFFHSFSHLDGQKNIDLTCAPALSRPWYRRAREGSHRHNSVFGAHKVNAALNQYSSQRAATRPIADSPRTGLVTSILSVWQACSPRKKQGDVRRTPLVVIVRHNRPETSRPVGFKAVRRSTGMSASGWPTDLRGCASSPRSSASTSVVVAGLAGVGRTASPACCSRSPRRLVAPAAVALPSPSEISSSHLRIQNNIDIINIRRITTTQLNLRNLLLKLK